MSFVELCCKSNFSFLEGGSFPKELLAEASRLRMPKIALTDRNGVYGLPRAYEAILKNNLGVELICGATLTIENHPDVVFLCQTKRGYQLLCQLITALHAGKEKGEGFLTLPEIYEITSTHLTKYELQEPELFCLLSGPFSISQSKGFNGQNPNYETAYLFFKDLFKSNCYIKIVRYLDGLDDVRTEKTLEVSKHYGIHLVASNDVYYHNEQRKNLQDVLTCIRETTNLDEAGFKLQGNQERYLKSELQMKALFYDLPEAIYNSQLISQACQFSLNELKYTYPSEFIPEGETPQSYLKKVVYQCAARTYKGVVPQKVDDQIRRELDFFAKRGDEHYFLTVYDIVNFAQRNRILCQGRGSAANSIVCYVLGITSVDPIEMNLLFDRFMNDGRREPPDIDIDFEHERREEVIQYIFNRFGRHRAAMVGAIHTYHHDGAFVELCKAFNVYRGTISARELAKDFDQIAKNKHRRPLIDDYVELIKKFPRHLGTHTGGFLLSNDPLDEIVPIEPARMENRTIIQWDKDDIETLALMKIDILSIGFLTALRKACDLAQISWRDIPPNDFKTYQMIQKADTHGTFQIESRAQMQMLTQTLPKNYYDLVVEVALVRPSPSEGGMVKPYLTGLRNARMGKPFRIGSPTLEKILGRTHGIPIFQEQIMQISIEVAGFAPSEADELRRSLSKHRTSERVDRMGKKLFDALIAQNVPEKFAEDLFKYIQGYAHYGFPESHAASYASLAYKSAYMKCHYPAEFVAALINSQPMGFYSVDQLIQEFSRSGVKFLPIHPNKSNWFCYLEDGNTVRMGFSHVRKIKQFDFEQLHQERMNKPFVTLEDFLARTSFHKDVLENLALANAFECYGHDQRHTFWNWLELSKLTKRNTYEAQLSLFTEVYKSDQSANQFRSLSTLEKMNLDYETKGYSLDGNLMKGLREKYRSLPASRSRTIKLKPHGERAFFAGLLTVFQRPPPAKGTAFLTLSDEMGTVDVIVRPEVYEKYKAVLKSTRTLYVEGKIQRKGSNANILADHIENFSSSISQKPLRPQAHPREMKGIVEG